MDRTETLEPPADMPSMTPKPVPKGRPLSRRVMHLVRRTHLYVGLFLFPWAILYGLTGFLFNHPTVLADAPTTHFNRDDVAGTPLESAPTPQEQATAVLANLNDQQQPATPYTMATGDAHYATRESFVATVKADSRTFFVVYDPKTASGSIRETTTRAVVEKAPFATATGDAPRQRGMGMGGPMKHNHSGVKVGDSIIERLKTAVPTIMERKGFPRGEVTVTTSPDIKFPVEADGQVWTATFNPITTNVSGTAGPERSELTARTFLLRLHLSRGYPGEVTTKWLWAVGVDAMALILCFWGVSGLLMWWQIKATRKAGLAVLALSAVAATALGVGMYAVLAA
ncbi:MAG: PepSY domain-containing protein [Gemmataceae bacterium]|nr:PepSY domain-containing protein [Gemmataceae bacterium]